MKSRREPFYLTSYINIVRCRFFQKIYKLNVLLLNRNNSVSEPINYEFEIRCQIPGSTVAIREEMYAEHSASSDLLRIHYI
jgi:hypothetical protein